MARKGRTAASWARRIAAGEGDVDDGKVGTELPRPDSLGLEHEEDAAELAVRSDSCGAAPGGCDVGRQAAVGGRAREGELAPRSGDFRGENGERRVARGR